MPYIDRRHSRPPIVGAWSRHAPKRGNVAAYNFKTGEAKLLDPAGLGSAIIALPWWHEASCDVAQDDQEEREISN